MTRKAAVVLLLAGLVLALGNGLAYRLLPEVPPSRDEARNPFRFRGFPEFVRGSSSAPTADSKTVVLLSNSQAYAGEYSPRMATPTGCGSG